MEEKKLLVEPQHPSLRKKSSIITKGSDITNLLGDMNSIFDTHQSAVGIAAPQLGVNQRVFMVNFGGRMVFINPKILKKFGLLVPGPEGCLSLPGTTINVKRFEKVYVEFYDSKWIPHREIFSGFIARIIQHEQDHLNGKLIIDYV